MRRTWRIFVPLLLLLSGCSLPYELNQRNLAKLYFSGNAFTKPLYLVHHQQDSLSVLYYSFQWNDFLYTKTDQQPRFTARALLKVHIRDDYDSKLPGDSIMLYLLDSLHHEQHFTQVDSLRLFLSMNYEHLLEISLVDLNREKEVSTYLPVYKTYQHDQQFFLPRDGLGMPLFEPILEAGESFCLEVPPAARDKVWVRYYRRDFPIATAPFAPDLGEAFDYKEDSLFTLAVTAGKTAYLQLEQQGFYHFQTDSLAREGFTLFRFHPDFPGITSVKQTLDPLRYITTKREFDQLSSDSNTKLAVDSFWLEKAGNINRARSQIAKYYNRVQDANRLFTSYLEGWKTDRGMIYVVFGPPTHVFRGNNTENWVYGDAGYSLSLRFSFVRVNNPFTYNDYSLYRNPTYKEIWYNAVENWRR